MIETYRLVLTHHMVDTKTGERIKLDEPICTEYVIDHTYGGVPVLLNRMFDELKAYTLSREKGAKNETD